MVKSNHFKNRVVKHIDGMEADLTMVEELTCGKLKMCVFGRLEIFVLFDRP